ncbi:hypothetical protein [Glutamicibacter protophormiae]|uniref:Uncharacterized protein n=2 Tax=Glutamicibacter protophormiae TaxID=37930 RepID=A0ABS4XMT1_GLUPR|nr:hypothetical protein [Glutamicibacter protophormiae]MBP2397685.1 hypothetical protein [Glutamicibacter protophormiae]GGL87347.1 hypothetical protein GCM10010038_16750 [Glutamicibacter protophormiae]
MTQLGHLAQKTHTAIGDLLLTEVPVGTVPIPDYRTVADAHLSSPSVNLLNSIYICERWQDWYRRYAINNGHEPLAFVGSLTTNTNLQTAAALVFCPTRVERGHAQAMDNLDRRAFDAGRGRGRECS